MYKMSDTLNILNCIRRMKCSVIKRQGRNPANGRDKQRAGTDISEEENRNEIHQKKQRN